MTNILKCSNCNIIVDELLAFIQNKVDVMDEDSLCRICVSAFDSTVIKTSKSLLFESLATDQKKKVRKNKGKEQRDVEDIVLLFKSVTNPEIIPVFVARDLSKLPPVTFDHVDVTDFLKKMVLMRQDIDEIKSSRVSMEQLQSLERKVQNIENRQIITMTQSEETGRTKSPCLEQEQRSPQPVMSASCCANVNIRPRRQMSFLDSGPMGLTNFEVSCQGDRCQLAELSDRHDGLTCGSEGPIDASPSPKLVDRCVLSRVKELSDRHDDAGLTCCREGPKDVCPSPKPQTTSERPSDQVNRDRKSGNEKAATETCNIPIRMPRMTQQVTLSSTPKTMADMAKDGEWKQVQTRKARRIVNKFMGRTGAACYAPEFKFQAADLHVPLFISNVDMQTTQENIAAYITAKTGEQVTLSRINIQNGRRHNAFKIMVSKKKLPQFLDKKLWPEGIIFRRFMPQKPPVAGGGKVIELTTHYG